MSDDHNAADKAHAKKMTQHQLEQTIERAIYAVKRELRSFSDDERKRVLDEALSAIDSKLEVRQGTA